MGRAGQVECMRATRNAYEMLFGKPEMKALLRRPRLRWEDSIKTDLKQDVRLWIGFIWLQDRAQCRTL